MFVYFHLLLEQFFNQNKSEMTNTRFIPNKICDPLTVTHLSRSPPPPPPHRLLQQQPRRITTGKKTNANVTCHSRYRRRNDICRLSVIFFLSLSNRHQSSQCTLIAPGKRTVRPSGDVKTRIETKVPFHPYISLCGTFALSLASIRRFLIRH